MILTNGRLIFPDRIEEAWSLRIAHGQIEEIGPAIVPNDEEIIDLGGNYLAPGFIDLHVHGAIGRDTMEGTEEAFRGICNYHAGGGTTSLCLTTVTAPIAGIVRVLTAIDSSLEKIPQLRGAHVEGPFISPAKLGAQRKEFILEPRAESIAPLLENSNTIRRVTFAP